MIETHLKLPIGDSGFETIESVSFSRWDKTHTEPDFKIGDQVLISTVNFNNLQGPKKLQDSFVGPFVVTKLHGRNAVEVILTGEFERKHPVFPVSLLKPYHTTDKDKYRDKDQNSPVIPTIDTVGEKKFLKILKQKRIRNNNQDLLLYLVRYKNRSAEEDEWLPADKIPNSKIVLRAYRANKRDHPA